MGLQTVLSGSTCFLWALSFPHQHCYLPMLPKEQDPPQGLCHVTCEEQGENFSANRPVTCNPFIPLMRTPGNWFLQFPPPLTWHTSKGCGLEIKGADECFYTIHSLRQPTSITHVSSYDQMGLNPSLDSVLGLYYKYFHFAAFLCFSSIF